MTGINGILNGFLRKSKFGRSVMLRPLTSKQGNRLFYKGKGCRNQGKHIKNGGYRIDRNKLLEIEMPDLTGFQLKPYVSPLTPDKPTM